MTTIHIGGFLSKIYGKKFIFKINSCSNALRAIECIKPGFLKKFFELSKMGYNYQIIADAKSINNKNDFIKRDKIKNIYIIPSISGGVAEETIGQIIMQAIIQAIVQAIISALVQLAVSLITMALLNQGTTIKDRNEIAVGGSFSAINAASKSYIFSNEENKASQGSPIPIGYGKMKIGASIVFSSVKSFLSSSSFSSEMERSDNYKYILI